MKNLQLYFGNPFESRGVSMDRLKNGSNDHLQRLIAQNGTGEFNQEIADLTTAYDNYFGRLSGTETTRALRQSHTLAVNKHLEAFTKRVSQLNAFLASQDLKDKPVYQEFFPYGVQEFTDKIKKENAAQLMQQLAEAVARNAALAGGATVVGEFVEFLTTYNSLRNQQLGKKGEEKEKSRSRDAARKALTDQLFLNLLTVVRKFPGQSEMVSAFFDQTAFEGVAAAATGNVSAAAPAVSAEQNN